MKYTVEGIKISYKYKAVISSFNEFSLRLSLIMFPTTKLDISPKMSSDPIV